MKKSAQIVAAIVIILGVILGIWYCDKEDSIEYKNCNRVDSIVLDSLGIKIVGKNFTDAEKETIKHFDSINKAQFEPVHEPRIFPGQTQPSND